MSIIKYADDIHFDLKEVYEPSNPKIASNPGLSILLTQPEEADVDDETRQRFIKFAGQLKRVAPKANDFLYFSAIMLHAAEAALIDQVTGETKKDKNGNPITAEWEINKKGSWKWKCSDSNLRPYKNNNGDIFPEAELKRAYRKWIGRPLCKDHQSSSVDGIRGIIVDTYYDDKHKRVIGLCALDKINYPDLARKVSTGYAHDVSMGTAVGRSVCYECGNIATVEAEYCPCVKTKKTYGEINIDLSPIELSLVVTGADPGAKLRSIIASLNKYSEEKEERIDELKKAGCVTPGELERLEKEVEDLRKTVATILETKIIKEAIDPDKAALIRNLSESLKNITNPETKKKIEGAIEDLTSEVSSAADAVVVEPPYGVAGRKAMTSGHAESATEDLKSGGPTDLNNPTGFDTRFASDDLLNTINSKLDAMEHALRDISKGVQEAKNMEEQNMSDKLRERAAARRAMFQKSAYYQGGGGLNEPQTYPKEDAEKVRNTEDKQMVGMYLDENPENLGGGKEELSLKQKLSRAELEERKLKRHALLKGSEKEIVKTKSGTYVHDPASGSFEKVTEQEADMLEMNEVFGKQAYFQGGGGFNEPQTYPKDPMAEKVRNTEDKQMVGMYLNEDPDQLGGGKEELALKQKYLRADEKLRAKFVLAFKNDEKTVIDKERSRWEIYAGDKKVLEATGSEIYEDELEENWEVLASKAWGKKVLSTIKEHGLNKVAWMLKGDGFTKTAQPPAPGAPPAPPMPPMDMGAPPAPGGEAPPLPEGEDKEKGGGDPVEEAIETLTKSLEEAEKSLGDLKDAVQKTTGESETKLPSPAEAADGDEDEDEDEKGEDACEKCGKCPCECKEEDASDAAADVADQVQAVYAALDESADELAMLAESLESRKRAGKTAKDVVTAELLRLAREALASNAAISQEAALIATAAKKKEKDEEEEEDKPKKGKGKKEEEEKPKKGKGKKDEEEEEKPKKGKGKKEEKDDEEEEPKKGKKSKAEQLLENLLNARAAKRREMVRTAEDMDVEVEGGDDVSALKAKVDSLEKELAQLKSEEKEEMLSGEEPTGAHPEMAEELGLEVSEADADMESYLDDELAALLKGSEEDEGEEDEELGDFEGAESEPTKLTAAARKAWRESLAAEVGAKYQLKLDSEITVDTDMPLHETHKLERLDTKTDEATFEGIVDMHEEIMKQVKTLPKVREAMDHLGNMLKSGQLKVAELDNQAKLLALAVDPACAKYWRDYFGQGDKDAKAFGTELVKEFTTKKAELNVEEQKLRLKRAFDLALDMQEKDIIGEGRALLLKQAEDLAKLSDEQFESLKKVVARANKKLSKTAAQTPALNVGVNASDDIGEGTDSPSLTNALARMWDK